MHLSSLRYNTMYSSKSIWAFSNGFLIENDTHFSLTQYLICVKYKFLKCFCNAMS